VATGNIYSGQTGTLNFPEKMTVASFTSAPYAGNSYYVARGATVYFYEDATLVGQKTYDPLAAQGQTTILETPLPNINKVVHSYGWGSAWGGDGGGQACPGISINGTVVRSVSTARRVYFKVGGGEYPNLKITDALGVAAILSNINSLEIPQTPKTKFNIFVKKDGSRECFTQAQFGKDLKVSFSQKNSNDDYGLHTASIIGTPSFIDKKFTSNGVSGLEYNLPGIENGLWCIQGKFKFNTISARYYCFVSGGYNVNLLRESTNKLVVYLSSNGSSWNISGGSIGIKSNWDIITEYYIRVRFTGSQYLVDWSTDGISWTNDITINNTSSIYPNMSSLFFGISNDRVTNPLAGTMDNLQVTLGASGCTTKNNFVVGRKYSNPSQNDIFYDVSGEASLLKYDGTAWQAYEGIYIGSLTTDANGYIDTVFQPEFNQNGYEVNAYTQGYRVPDYDKVIYMTGCNTPKQVLDDSYVCIWGTDPYTEVWGAFVGRTSLGPWRQVGYRYDDVNGSTQGTSFTFFVPKGWYFYGTAENNTYANVFPMKEDMMTLNKYMVNRIAGILQLVKDKQWYKLVGLVELYKNYGADWDKAEPDIEDLDACLKYIIGK